MNRIRNIGRFACLLAELTLAGRTQLTKAAKSRVRHRIAMVAALAGLVAPLAAALPATAAPEAGAASPDVVTQWNLTMIAGLEAAAVPPPSARIGAIVQASVFARSTGSSAGTRSTTSPQRRPAVLPPPPPLPAQLTPRWSP